MHVIKLLVRQWLSNPRYSQGEKRKKRDTAVVVVHLSVNKENLFVYHGQFLFIIDILKETGVLLKSVCLPLSIYSLGRELSMKENGFSQITDQDAVEGP
jgi:hypothetical protein